MDHKQIELRPSTHISTRSSPLHHASVVNIGYLIDYVTICRSHGPRRPKSGYERLSVATSASCFPPPPVLSTTVRTIPLAMSRRPKVSNPPPITIPPFADHKTRSRRLPCHRRQQPRRWPRTTDSMTTTTTDSATTSRAASRRGNRVPPGESHPVSAPHRPPHRLLAAPRRATSLTTLWSPAAPTSVATSAPPSPPPSRLPRRHHRSPPKKPTGASSTPSALLKAHPAPSKTNRLPLDNPRPFTKPPAPFRQPPPVQNPPTPSQNPTRAFRQPAPFQNQPAPCRKPTPAVWTTHALSISHRRRQIDRHCPFAK